MFRAFVLTSLVYGAVAFAPVARTRSASSLPMGKVVVELDKVTGLQDSDSLGTSDPYVKFELEQDNALFQKDKDYGDKVSSKKPGQTSPEYGETFEWEDVDDLTNVVLRCKVMDDDPLFDDKIGSCTFNLDEMDLSEEPQEVMKIVDNNLFSEDGKIFLKLSYAA